MADEFLNDGQTSNNDNLELKTVGADPAEGREGTVTTFTQLVSRVVSRHDYGTRLMEVIQSRVQQTFRDAWCKETPFKVCGSGCSDKGQQYLLRKAGGELKKSAAIHLDKAIFGAAGEKSIADDPLRLCFIGDVEVTLT